MPCIQPEWEPKQAAEVFVGGILAGVTETKLIQVRYDSPHRLTIMECRVPSTSHRTTVWLIGLPAVCSRQRFNTVGPVCEVRIKRDVRGRGGRSPCCSVSH